MLRYLFILLFWALPCASFAQSFTTIDTVFTPPDYPDVGLSGTLFVPTAPNGVAIVAVHGLGDPVSTMDGWSDSLAANGYTVLNIDYPDPVNGGATFPMPSRAIKAAVQFLRRSDGHFQLNGIVGAIGRSIGSGIIAQSLIDEGNYSYYGIDSTTSDHIDFAALLYGIYDFNHFTQSNLPIPISQFALQNYFGGDMALEDSATPVLHADHITTPLLLIHGEFDSTLQYQQSIEFHDSLDANGKPNDLILYPGEPHFFEAPNDGQSFTSIGLQVKDSVLAYFSYESAHAAVGVHSLTTATAQNYPNPCGLSSPSGSGTTTLSFYLPRDAECSIELLNAMGEAILKMPPKFFNMGEEDVTLPIRNLPSGAYFLRVQSSVTSFTRATIIEN